MRLNNYIFASLLSHILLFGVIIMFYPEMSIRISAPVFDVDIVGSVEEAVPGTIKIPVIPVPPLPEKPEETGPPPETMFGKGTAPESSESGKEETKEGTTSAEEEDIFSEVEEGPRLIPKSFLFDKKTIEKYAQKSTKEEKGLTFDVPEFHHRGYMRRLKDKIERIWRYPKAASRRGISGDLYIRFSINRDGSLGDVELVRTSGYKDLDRAAMDALKNAEPYWPLPEDWKEDQLSITGHFLYLIGRTYVL